MELVRPSMTVGQQQQQQQQQNQQRYIRQELPTTQNLQQQQLHLQQHLLQQVQLLPTRPHHPSSTRL
jgi:hypothetical protein